MLNIYKASAGSGKTFTLTRQYLTLLLGFHDKDKDVWRMYEKPRKAHRHILAITFTNKATNEMVERIIKELALLGGLRSATEVNANPGAAPRRSDHLDYFTELFNQPAEKVQKLAGEVLFDLLFDFAYFHISTIDAFFQTVIRTFAREIDLPDDFGVELDNSYFIALGVAEMFSDLNRNPSSAKNRWLKTILIGQMERNLEDGHTLNIFAPSSDLQVPMVKTLKSIMNEDFKMLLPQLRLYLDNLDLLISFIRKLRKLKSSARSLLTEKAIKLLAAIGPDEKGINSNFYKFVVATSNGIIKEKISKYAIDNANPEPEDFPACLTFWNKTYWKKSKLALTDQLTLANEAVDFCKLCVDVYDFIPFLKLLTPGLELLGILTCVLDKVNELSRDKNTILLSESNTLLHNIINDDETPFVYERLGYYLNHYLIDEFQDTSKMQWENIRSLLNESMSNGNANLIIGDVKQCIYRFRNSAPELLGNEAADFFCNRRHPLPVKIKGDTIDQNTNWRSHEAIVKFNNTLFRRLGRDINASDIYDTTVQAVSPKKSGAPALISACFFDADNSKLIKELKAEDGEETDKLHPLAVRATIDEIIKLLKQGRRLSDIGILVRTNNEGEQIISALLNLNEVGDPELPKIEVSSADAMALSASEAVKIVIDVMRMMVVQREKITTKTSRNGSVEITKKLSNLYKINLFNRWYKYFLYNASPERPASPDRDDNEARVSAIMAALAKVDALEEQLKNHSASADESADTDLGRLLSSTPASAAANDLHLDFFSIDALVDIIIDRFVPKQLADEESIFLHALNDAIAEYREFGTEDIKSFLEWWDARGRFVKIQSSDDVDAIRVMTIHKSKGLEIPCVFIPGADWKMVEESSAQKQQFNWMNINADQFIDYINRFYSPDTAPADRITINEVPLAIPLEFKKKLADFEVFKQQADEIITKQRIDNMNLAYVAFTRAIEQLYIYGKYSQKAVDSNQPALLSEYVINALTSITDDSIRADLDSTVDSPDTRLELAKWLIPLAPHTQIVEAAPEQPEADNFDSDIDSDAEVTDSDSDILVNQVEFVIDSRPESSETNPSSQASTLPAEAPLKADSESLVAGLTNLYQPGTTNLNLLSASADLQVPDFNNPKWRGNFIHHILSRIYEVNPGRLALEVRRACHRAHLSAEIETEVLDQLTRSLANPKVASWFSGFSRVANERSLIYNNGEIIRADRIVWQPDGSVDIIDYKTGKENESAYVKQILKYVEAMRLTTKCPVRAHLWYLTDDVIDHVDC